MARAVGGVDAAVRQAALDAQQFGRGRFDDLRPFQAERGIAGGAEGLPTTGLGIREATADQPELLVPSELGENIIGLQPIETGLSRRQRVVNTIRGTTRIGVPDDSVTRRAFEIDDAGRIPALAGIDPSVPGAPTLPDVAARLPAYEPHLDDARRAALAQLQRDVPPYGELFREVGIETGSRSDVQLGGFYLPRGRATQEGADEPIRRSGRGRRGGKIGAERPAVFESQAADIKAGWEYPRLAESLQSYAEGAGRRATDQHVANYFKAARDPVTGELLGEGPRARVLRQQPELARKVEGLRTRLRGLTGTEARLSRRQQAAIEEFLESPAPDLDALDETLDPILARDVLTSKVVDSDRLPAAVTLRGRIEDLRGQLSRDPQGVLRKNKANDALSEQIGDLEALADLREAIDQSDGDVFEVLDVLTRINERIGREVEIRSDPGLRATLTPSGPSQRRRLSRTTARPTIDQFGNEGDDFAILARRSATLNEIVQSSGFDVRLPPGQLPNRGRQLELFDRTVEELAKRRDVQVRASATGARGPNFGKTSAEVQRQITATRRELNEALPAWRKAVQRAQLTPQGQGGIHLRELGGTSFPAELTAAVNKVLDAEGASGNTLLGAANALNDLYRGAGATLDNSFMGVQGLLGLADDPAAYRQALGRVVGPQRRRAAGRVHERLRCSGAGGGGASAPTSGRVAVSRSAGHRRNSRWGRGRPPWCSASRSCGPPTARSASSVTPSGSAGPTTCWTLSSARVARSSS